MINPIYCPALLTGRKDGSLALRAAAVYPVEEPGAFQRILPGNHLALQKPLSYAADRLLQLIGETVLRLFIYEMLHQCPVLVIQEAFRGKVGIGPYNLSLPAVQRHPGIHVRHEAGSQIRQGVLEFDGYVVIDVHARVASDRGDLHFPDFLLQDIGGDFVGVDRDVPGRSAAKPRIEIAVVRSLRRDESDGKFGNLRNSDSVLGQPQLYPLRGGQEAAPHGLHDEDAPFPRLGKEALRLRAVLEHGLLAEHGDAPLHAHHGQAVMVVGRHGNVGAVRLFPVQKLLIAAVGLWDAVLSGENFRPLQALAGHGADLAVLHQGCGQTEFRRYLGGSQYGISKCTHSAPFRPPLADITETGSALEPVSILSPMRIYCFILPL